MSIFTLVCTITTGNQNGDESLPSIILAGQGLLVKIHFNIIET